MYGNHVHQAVIDQKETVSGITIHFVNREYDQWQNYLSGHLSGYPADTAGILAAKFMNWNTRHFPKIIKQEILKASSMFSVMTVISFMDNYFESLNYQHINHIN